MHLGLSFIVERRGFYAAGAKIDSYRTGFCHKKAKRYFEIIIIKADIAETGREDGKFCSAARRQAVEKCALALNFNT
ncbi:hypothetical protein [Pseudescherichia sp.]|uniref:hypothetical protein n=1 Tax=Pseudescherichia sp. TaxID=2055881 RepID=UPI00289C0ED7|nr:hypothetical protein [Pseudescherichia sp.]